LDKSVSVVVISDKDQKEKNNGLKNINGVDIIYSKYAKSNSPLLYYFDSILLSLKNDVILSCGNGGGYFSFITMFYKVKFLTNPDGLEWKRAKWSPLKRFLIKTMEWFSVKFSDGLVCDSEGITTYIKEQYRYTKKLYTIEYGAYVNKFLDVTNEQTKSILDMYKLKTGQYHLVVSRLEPENNVDMIIEGYEISNSRIPLIIVGNLNDTPYVKELEAKKSSNIIFLGGIYDKDALSIVRANAFSYLHGHSVGGTNPSLLEAMGSKNLCICHDNIFNRKTVGEHGLYFKTSTELKDIFNIFETKEQSSEYIRMRSGVLNSINDYYNWDIISKKYLEAFKDIIKRK
jgi:rhamnosyltransferase